MSKTPTKRAPLDRRHQDFGVRAGFLVHDVSRLRRAFFDGQMKPFGLTRSQWWVLGQLSRHSDRPMSQVELAKHLDVGKAALGALIDRIEAAGYVRRETVQGDRRVNLIAITPKGLGVTAVLRKIGHSLNVRIFGGLTDAEVLQLEETLSRVKENLLELSAGAEGAAQPARARVPKGAVSKVRATKRENSKSRTSEDRP